MYFFNNTDFGEVVTRLINGEHLSGDESYRAFCAVLNNEVGEIQQGAFLAALTAKGETVDEIAGGWKAIYERDTCKVQLDGNGVVDNCGTGMDSFKSFNISTAASIVAAANGLRIARHGARAISSKCGTVDVAEQLGVDVECSTDIVTASIEECGIGLFNGMSPHVHPGALGRILSQIHFGSPLNIAASLAHPAMPKKAVRGVYSKEMMQPVLEVMQKIGYLDVIVVHGMIDGDSRSMDEASVCGTTYCLRLDNGTIEAFEFRPEDIGLKTYEAASIQARQDPLSSARHMVEVISGRENGGCHAATALNAALILLVGGSVSSLGEGVELASDILISGDSLTILESWVAAQNRDPEAGIAALKKFMVG